MAVSSIQPSVWCVSFAVHSYYYSRKDLYQGLPAEEGKKNPKWSIITERLEKEKKKHKQQPGILYPLYQ